MSETPPYTPDTSQNLPGAILKRCREYHGITLNDAAEATKIGVRYLIALEEDRIGDFPSIAYLKGFLRIYATHLGLNAEDMLRLYEKSFAPATKGKARNRIRQEPEPDQQGFNWQKLILPAVLLLLMIITAVLINRASVPPQRQTALRPVTEPAAVPAVQPAISSARSVAPLQKKDVATIPAESAPSDIIEPERSTQKPAAEPDKSFIVRMRVTQNGSLVVTIDGAAPQNYELAIGDVIEWKAEKNIILELTNSGGVEAELNGQPLKPFGSADTPAYVVLGADGVKK